MAKTGLCFYQKQSKQILKPVIVSEAQQPRCYAWRTDGEEIASFLAMTNKK